MGYKMTHRDSKAEIEVSATAVATYETQGWETSPTAVPPTEGDEKKK